MVSELQITIIGHATTLINFDGQRILTDPWFNDPIHILCRHKYPLGIPLDKLPPIDLIVISHRHKDHFDIRAIERINHSATVIMPSGETSHIERLGFYQVKGLDFWESQEIGGLRVTALPAVHPIRENCYLFEKDEKSVFFGGDTQPFPGMSEIGNKFSIKVALLPISGMRWFQGRFGLIRRICMGPSEAVEAALRLKARVVIPIHYHITCFIPFYNQFITPGTPKEFKEQMEKKAPQVQVVVLDTGEVWEDNLQEDRL